MFCKMQRYEIFTNNTVVILLKCLIEDYKGALEDYKSKATARRGKKEY